MSILDDTIDGRYRVVRKLGKGGMGEVYLAEHVHLRRPAALKVLRSSIAARPQFAARFRREARATHQVSHPNIVAVYDFGQLPDGRFYLAMEFVDGISLREALRRDGALPLPRVLAVVEQLADAIDHAHRQGVVHRDIKPDNLILVASSDGAEVLKVLDFGIAKIIAPDYEDSVAATRRGELGTPAYMAPELFQGTGDDPRCDIYALGCVLYELCVGKPPFAGRPVQLFQAHRDEPPPRPSAEDSTLPRELDALVEACMAKLPADRPATGADVIARIRMIPARDE